MVSSLAAIQGPPGLVARQTQRCAAAASPKTRSTGALQGLFVAAAAAAGGCQLFHSCPLVYCACIHLPDLHAGIAAVPAFRKHCQQTVPRLPTARACGGEGERGSVPFWTTSNYYLLLIYTCGCIS